MSDSKMFICLTMTIMLSDRSMVAPNTPFRGEDVVPATLKSMLENETIQVFDPAEPPKRLPRYPVGKTELGIKKEDEPEKDPTAHIGLHRRPPETKSEGTNARKVLVRSKLNALGVTMPFNARLDTMEARLEREVKTNSVLAGLNKKNTGGLEPPQSVWDADPEELKEIPEDRLLTVYREQCERYEIVTQLFDSKELLIAYMSSQFVKK